jgi:hypothetical protein
VVKTYDSGWVDASKTGSTHYREASFGEDSFAPGK